MKSHKVEVSKNFKKMAVKSVKAILLFVATYFLLILAALAFTFICTYCGIRIIQIQGTWLTYLLGISLMAIGFLILFFLVKFVFTSNKTDQSQYYKITADQEPQLFDLIKEIANSVQTSLPKNVYLSPDVNAGVFYSSTFWSMFFPNKKNLVIGVGLLNTVSIIEFKAILAHEFGHFSQRSMIIGSFVHNVNRVLYNLLYDNESYEKMITFLSGINNFFSLFTSIAAWIISGIQWVLHKVYENVNTNYLALSKEMEFHADAISAEVVGSEPAITALMRSNMSNECFSLVLQYYNHKTADAEITDNFYSKQHLVMQLMAEEYNLPVINGLPQVNTEHEQTFNKSKLVLTDPWSSHPETSERVAALELLNKPVKEAGSEIAINLLKDKNATSTRITKDIFARVNYTQEPIITDDQHFLDRFKNTIQRNSYPEVFNGYYSYKDPLTNKDEKSFDYKADVIVTDPTILFSKETIATLSTIAYTNADLEILIQISEGVISAPSFDYDGQKYTDSDCLLIIENVKEELSRLNDASNLKNEEIFDFFLSKANEKSLGQQFKEKYLHYQTLIKSNESFNAIIIECINAMSFTQTTTEIEEIELGFIIARTPEENFKKLVGTLLSEPVYQEDMTVEMKINMETYFEGNFKYFKESHYINREITILSKALEDSGFLINKSSFKVKSSLLDFQAELMSEVSEPAFNEE